MKEFFKRLSAETPKFFLRISYFGASILTLGVGIATIPGIPEWLKSHAETAIVVGSVMAVFGKLPNKDPQTPQS